MQKQLTVPASTTDTLVDIQVNDAKLVISPENDTLVKVAIPPQAIQTSVTNVPKPPDPPSGGVLALDQNYEDAGSVNTNQGQYNTRSNIIKHGGNYSFRSEVRVNQPALYGGYRSEMQYGFVPTEGYLEYWVYYENWRSTEDGGHVIQFHPNSPNYSAVASLQAYQGQFLLVRNIRGTNYFGTKNKPVPPNKWMKTKIEFRFSQSSDGYLKVFFDDVLFDQMLNVITTDQYGLPYLKVGQNRWLVGNEISDTTVVYYDDVKVYQTKPATMSEAGYNWDEEAHPLKHTK